VSRKCLLLLDPRCPFGLSNYAGLYTACALMATLTPRASGLWASTMSTGYFDGDDGDVEAPSSLDGRTPLDRTIDRIGMGALYTNIRNHLLNRRSRHIPMGLALIVRFRCVCPS
jgi:hypothetical protein